MPDPATATATAIYQCPDCGERTGDRRCPDCNLFTARIGAGGACPCCGEVITIDELEAPTN